MTTGDKKEKEREMEESKGISKDREKNGEWKNPFATNQHKTFDNGHHLPFDTMLTFS